MLSYIEKSYFFQNSGAALCNCHASWVVCPNVVLCPCTGVGIKPNKHLNRQLRRGTLPPMSERAVRWAVWLYSAADQAEAAL